MNSGDQVNASDDKSVPVYGNGKEGLRESSSDAEMGSGNIEVTGTTKRGLKARHAQMIALGGTIGSFPYAVYLLCI
jgi:yeast amino acid transporter